MTQFFYEAKDASGKKISGLVEARNMEAAAQVLRQEGKIILDLKEKTGENLAGWSLRILNRVRAKEVVFFSHQLATLLSASVPLVRALRILMKQTSNVYFQGVITNIAEDVDGGMKFSQSLNRYPHIFDNFFVQMIRAGETTGRLDQVLDYLSVEKEKDYTLLAEIRGAMIYPAFILAMLVIVAFLMLTFVLPRITSVLLDLDVELPLSTKILIGVSNIFSHYWWAILIIVFIIGVALYFLRTVSEFVGWWERLKIRTPIFGPILQRIYFIRMTRSLGSLIGAGVPIVSSLLVASDIVGSKVYKDLMVETAKRVETGSPITSVLARSKFVPAILVSMLAIGEESGRMESVLTKVADFYAGELARMIKGLFQLIEPLIIVILGVATGFLIVSILLPLYNLTLSVG